MANKTQKFVCKFCKQPGEAAAGTKNPQYHRPCYAESQRTPGSDKVPCVACGKPREKTAVTGQCKRCEHLSRTTSIVKPLDEQLLDLLKRGEHTPRTLAEKTSQTPGVVLDTLLDLQRHGRNIHSFGDLWSLEKRPQTGAVEVPTLESNADGWHRIAALGDTHLCSKHERLEELRDFYRIIEANDIKTVLHTGNYVDGEARFNKFELLVHGMDAQLQYLCNQYPTLPGVTTYAVSGDDHEGWYCQREGVDIGRYTEDVMRRGGRTDWKNLGYMEAFLPIRHAKTGAEARIHVMHPGGGSAYATSYTVQKIVEGYEGGEKPAILLAGHYHKMEDLVARNVMTFQTGCFQDQTVFARKKKLTFTIGAWILMFRQNPETGAVEEMVTFKKQYFNRGYYQNNRWSLSGPVVKVPRLAA